MKNVITLSLLEKLSGIPLFESDGELEFKTMERLRETKFALHLTSTNIFYVGPDIKAAIIEKDSAEETLKILKFQQCRIMTMISLE